jgi:phage anti-repressor protein
MKQALAIIDTASETCDARDLHGALAVETRFNDWITRRITEYGFVEGEDYYSNLSNRSDGRAGRQRTEYHLSLDMAKELAMLENSDLGRRVRRYFIQAEKELRKRQIEHHKAQIEHHKALAIEARDQFLERATQAERLYRELHDKRSVEVPTSAGRFNILDVFHDHRVEQGKDGALLIHGHVTGVEQEVTVRCHRGRWFMDQLVLCEVFGLSPLQTKKLTTQADRCVVDGRLLLDLRCMPKPLTNLVM